MKKIIAITVLLGAIGCYASLQEGKISAFSMKARDVLPMARAESDLIMNKANARMTEAYTENIGYCPRTHKECVRELGYRHPKCVELLMNCQGMMAGGVYGFGMGFPGSFGAWGNVHPWSNYGFYAK